MTINMMKSAPLVDDLCHKSERYQKLHQIFAEFCLRSSWLATEKSPVPSITHKADLANNVLDVSLCGRTIRFEFSFDPQTGTGKVSCYLIPLRLNDEPVRVDTFPFVGTGDTELRSADTGDTLNMRTESGASYLILHFVQKALTKFGET